MKRHHNRMILSDLKSTVIKKRKKRGNTYLYSNLSSFYTSEDGNMSSF